MHFRAARLLHDTLFLIKCEPFKLTDKCSLLSLWSFHPSALLRGCCHVPAQVSVKFFFTSSVLLTCKMITLEIIYLLSFQTYCLDMIYKYKGWWRGKNKAIKSMKLFPIIDQQHLSLCFSCWIKLILWSWELYKLQLNTFIWFLTAFWMVCGAYCIFV